MSANDPKRTSGGASKSAFGYRFMSTRPKQVLSDTDRYVVRMGRIGIGPCYNDAARSKMVAFVSRTDGEKNEVNTATA
jgi:hypothetical protein